MVRLVRASCEGCVSLLSLIPHLIKAGCRRLLVPCGVWLGGTLLLLVFEHVGGLVCPNPPPADMLVVCVRPLRCVGDKLIVLSVVLAEGERPVPSRTRKLSLPAPMILPCRVEK